MPMVETVVSNVRGVVKRPRPGPRGIIKPGTKAKPFNNFGRIADAFPDAIGSIVVETTELLGNVATAMAPVQQNPRRGDPAPGTLKRSKRTRYYRRRGTDLVISGRVEWTAKDPRGHRYAKPLETTSIRKTRRGLIRVTKGSGWLVAAIVPLRSRFIRLLSGLESRLPS